MPQRFLKSLAHNSITDDILVAGLSTFDDLLRVVQQFPYGRNENRADPELVWWEQKGTCSSKHAFLKKVASEQHFNDVKLMLGIYKMSPKNTTGLSNALVNTGLSYIPEAHCYLNIAGERLDITFPDSDINKLLPDIMEERFIEWSDVETLKVDFHKGFLKNWLAQHADGIQSGKSFEEIWQIREQCILDLSNR